MISTIETSGVWNGGEITKDMYTEIQQSMIKSAEGIANKAKQLVPVGEGVPRHLRDTIRAVGKRKRTQLELLARGLVGGGAARYETALPGAWVFAGQRTEDKDASVYWAHWVEFGTYSGPARPFMRPAADAGFNPTLAEAARAGRRVVNKRRRTRTAARKRRIEGL